MNQAKQKAALALKKAPTYSTWGIGQIVGISRNTYYKYTACVDGETPPQRPRPTQRQPALR